MSAKHSNKTSCFSYAELIIFATIILFIGIESGFFLYLYAYKYASNSSEHISIQVDPFSIVTLIITIIVSVYLLRTLNKRDEHSKKVTGLLTDVVSKWGIEFEDYMKHLIGSPKGDVLYISVTQKMKVFRMRMHSIIKLNQTEGTIQSNCATAMSIDGNLHDILEILTDTARPGQGSSQQTEIRAGKIILGDEVIFLLETKIMKHQELIFSLVREIDEYR